MKAWPIAAVCIVAFLVGCWIARPARYQIVQVQGANPIRMDTSTGEVRLMVWDEAKQQFVAQTGAGAAQK